MPKFCGYIIGKAWKGEKFSMAHEYLTEDGGWHYDNRKARVFDKEDFTPPPKSRHAVDEEIERQRNLLGNENVLYAFALVEDVSTDDKLSEFTPANNPFIKKVTQRGEYHGEEVSR